MSRRPLEVTEAATQAVPAALLGIRKGLAELGRIAAGRPRAGEKVKPTCRDVLAAHAHLLRLVEQFAPNLRSVADSREYRAAAAKEALLREQVRLEQKAM
jgi:hypothetical protein